MNRTTRRGVPLLAAATLALAACGGGSDGSPSEVTQASAAAPTSAAASTSAPGAGPSGSTGSPGSTAPASSAPATTVASLDVRPESAASSQLPEVLVRQVQTGTEVQLKNLLPSDKPLLVWFWAPH